MRVGEFILAMVVALVLLWLLSNTQTGANIFFLIKGSQTSST